MELLLHFRRQIAAWLPSDSRQFLKDCPVVSLFCSECQLVWFASFTPIQRDEVLLRFERGHDQRPAQGIYPQRKRTKVLCDNPPLASRLNVIGDVSDAGGGDRKAVEDNLLATQPELFFFDLNGLGSSKLCPSLEMVSVPRLARPAKPPASLLIKRATVSNCQATKQGKGSSGR